ncbi:GYDIA family GHMP kinase [uncultured Psychroserpens sp.]|uniref:GYDIA family GHMP kinase n=1 Tax=uncultured Psychroserpens sp. TaxID=255436 RepID=UPI00263569B9|nr:GYDIA family GHMP kinase [uncultured Psychroserpens sp.]
MESYYSHGKLLLTGEYVVLDGANALAVPTRLGQGLRIDNGFDDKLHWKSFDYTKKLWYEAKFSITNNNISALSNSNSDITSRLLQILTAAKTLNPNFLNQNNGLVAISTTEFPKDWGLGTSSTLINNIANWARVDAYKLLQATFGGSGYDIACAEAEKSLTYQLVPFNSNKTTKGVEGNHTPIVKTVNFNPVFEKHLYFVYLNQKQNSRDGIAQYRANTSNLSSYISRVTQITKEMIACTTLDGFQQLMGEHEQLISTIIKQVPVRERLFSDFTGSIKSLGAWGGDFVMVASHEDPTSYFKTKGFDTILNYSEMVRN